MRSATAYVFLNGIERLETQPQTGRYFVAHEYPQVEPDDYREHLSEGLAPQYQPLFPDKRTRLKHILHRICEMVLSTDFGVYDISNRQKPNIFLELGVAVGLEKPVILTRRVNPKTSTQGPEKLPFGLQGLEILEYSSYADLRDNIGPRVRDWLGRGAGEGHLTNPGATLDGCACAKPDMQSAILIASNRDDQDFLSSVKLALGDLGFDPTDAGLLSTASFELELLYQQLKQTSLGIYNISRPWYHTSSCSWEWLSVSVVHGCLC